MNEDTLIRRAGHYELHHIDGEDVLTDGDATVYVDYPDDDRIQCREAMAAMTPDAFSDLVVDALIRFAL